MSRIITFLDDFIYSVTGWLEAQSEGFNAVVGAALSVFLVTALLIGLVIPQLGFFK
jgi:hypothetical protein